MIKSRGILIKQSSKTCLPTGFETYSEKIARRLSEELIILPSQKRRSLVKISQKHGQVDKQTDFIFTHRIACALRRHLSKFSDSKHLCLPRGRRIV